MASRTALRAELDNIIDDLNNQKWSTTQKNNALNQAIREVGKVVEIDGGTGFVTAASTVEYDVPAGSYSLPQPPFKLELEPASSGDRYSVLLNWGASGSPGSWTVRVEENLPTGRKLRASFFEPETVFTADADTTTLPSNYVIFYTAYLLAMNYIPKGARVDVAAYQKRGAVWRAEAMRSLRAWQVPAPTVPMRQRRGV